WAKTREILSFGVPNGVSTMAGFAARYWDNLLMAKLFGPGELGYYQLAYNLSELPSNQVGDHVGDVLLPAFARLPPERRGPALGRALRLLGLVMFPLSIGLGAMGPTVVAAFLAPAWQPMVAAVLGTRHLLHAAGVGSPLAHLICELVAGAAAYVAGALTLAAAISRELFMVLRTTLLDRKPRARRDAVNSREPAPRA